MGMTPQTVALLASQCSVVTRPQLLDQDVGLTSGQIDALLRRGHLERFHHGTYRRTGSAPTAHQEAMAAVLRCRPIARITGPRLLAFLGVEEAAVTDPFQLLVPPARRVQNVPFEVLPDLALGRGDAMYDGVPGTTPALTFLELARQPRWTDEALLKVFDRMRWGRILTRQRLESACRTFVRHPGSVRTRDLLGSPTGQVDSPGERDALDVLLRLDPPPELQVWVAPDLRVDALWRPYSLVIEYRGRDTHDDDRDRAADADRDARLRRLGYEVVHITVEDLRVPDALLARLHRAAGLA